MSSSAAQWFHCCGTSTVCPTACDKEVAWKSVPALSLLELEMSNDLAVEDSYLTHVKDVERRAHFPSVYQCWVQFSCVVRGDR